MNRVVQERYARFSATCSNVNQTYYSTDGSETIATSAASLDLRLDLLWTLQPIVRRRPDRRERDIVALVLEVVVAAVVVVVVAVVVVAAVEREGRVREGAGAEVH